MTCDRLISIISESNRYNLHSHTEYCDGRAPMASIAEAAVRDKFEVWGFTPHSPVPVESGCNMLKSDVHRYIAQLDELREVRKDELRLLCGMEVDFLGCDFGPHLDYFLNLPLDYRIGSVHFVPNQEGRFLDCDGSFDRFSNYLKRGFEGDLRYVVEKYFEQVLTMLERGGFEILGHFDKIIGNAVQADSALEEQGWYRSLVEDVISHAADARVIVEINTKAFETKGRFFPSEKWWPLLLKAGVPLAVNSDCHHPDRTNLGRPEALRRLNKLVRAN